MPRINVDFTDEEHAKLEKLAEFRKMSIEECLRNFAQSCQPGGSGWRHPSLPELKKK